MLRLGKPEKSGTLISHIHLLWHMWDFAQEHSSHSYILDQVTKNTMFLNKNSTCAVHNYLPEQCYSKCVQARLKIVKFLLDPLHNQVSKTSFEPKMELMNATIPRPALEIGVCCSKAGQQGVHCSLLELPAKKEQLLMSWMVTAEEKDR